MNSSKMLGNASLQNGLYVLLGNQPTTLPNTSCSFTSLGQIDNIMLWHFRLGHPNFHYLAKLFPKLFVNKNPSSFKCHICPLAK